MLIQYHSNTDELVSHISATLITLIFFYMTFYYVHYFCYAVYVVLS